MSTRAWTAQDNPTFEVRTPDGVVVHGGRGFYYLREQEKHVFTDGAYEQYRSHDGGTTWGKPVYMRAEHGKLRVRLCPNTVTRVGGFLVPCCKLLGHDGPC